MRTPHRIALLASALAIVLPATSYAAGARAELSDRDLVTDTPAQLTVTVEDGANPTEAPAIRVPGATTRFRGEMARSTIINGEARSEKSFVYALVPSRPGPLDIPAIEIQTDRGTVRTEPIHATVSNATTSAASPTRPASEPTRAFVRLEVPARKLYVGEAVPVKIRAYFRAGTAVTVQGAPKLSSEAFTLSDLSDKPAQTEVMIRGETYLQATWTAVLSPAKPMNGALSVELPVEIAYRERSRQQHRSLRDMFGGDPFGGMGVFDDPFFSGDPFAGMDIDLDSMFDVGPVQQRELKLRASAGKVTVVEPPVTGRPKNFTGAVGSFDLTAQPVTGEAYVGEPITLTWKVTGTGNLDRLTIAGVAESTRLKAYSVKSTTEAAGDREGGTKTFTQTIVPTEAGTLEIPVVEMPYFDPETRAYVTAKAEPIVLDVLPARGAPAAVTGAASSSSAPAEDLSKVPSERHATLSPMYRQPSFWLIPGALALVTALLAGAGWWRRSPRVAKALASRRLDRAVGRSLRDMDAAADGGDVQGFFTAARTALQLRLGDRFGIAPEAVTGADIEEHLGARGAKLRAIFERADDVAYAHGRDRSESLDHSRAIVKDELAHLEAS